uniref:Derlin n=1 Tax=Ornithorhynchus anatinus TaxID=9258 RepID=A0A6I8PCC9_ORNAN
MRPRHVRGRPPLPCRPPLPPHPTAVGGRGRASALSQARGRRHVGPGGLVQEHPLHHALLVRRLHRHPAHRRTGPHPPLLLRPLARSLPPPLPGAFDGRPADYMFMLLFNWICIVITGLIMDMQLLMIPLIMSVLYVWAQLNRDMIVSFWFGTRFKACYLPWVILGFNYIIGGSVINELVGNLVGHLYFFLMFKYPMDLGGRNFLSTPQFLYRWLPSRRGGISGFGVPPASMRRAAEDQPGGGGRHNWGQGFRLGDQ